MSWVEDAKGCWPFPSPTSLLCMDARMRSIIADACTSARKEKKRQGTARKPRCNTNQADKMPRRPKRKPCGSLLAVR
jgi:hypothetical protein